MVKQLMTNELEWIRKEAVVGWGIIPAPVWRRD
jgi:hypothetical protein